MEHKPDKPQQPDKPTTVPTPGDPRQKTPMRDPPVHPEHDNPDKTRIADPDRGPGGVEGVPGDDRRGSSDSDLEANGAQGSVRADNPSPDRVVFDENRSQR